VPVAVAVVPRTVVAAVLPEPVGPAVQGLDQEEPGVIFLGMEIMLLLLPRMVPVGAVEAVQVQTTNLEIS